MRQFVFLMIAVVSACRCAYSQTDYKPLTLPHSKLPNDAKVPVIDVAKLYADPREAALAAFKPGYLAAKENHSSRAMGLFLLALRRDPTFVKALFNLGVLCAEDQRWSDGEKFYGEVLRIAGDPILEKQARIQIERLQLIERLESTAEGKKERKFDLDLAAALKAKNLPAGIDQATVLMKLDGKRWEAPALAGILSAQLGRYAESRKFLEQASSLAPPERRDQIKGAAVLARRQADFVEATEKADGLWDQQKYARAAEEYSIAWGDNRDLRVAMGAVTGFLMADQVPQAVSMLTTIRASVPLDVDQKIVKMLKELAAVYPEAGAQAGKAVTPVENANAVEPNERIRIAVGNLASHDIEMIARPSPPLVEDRGNVTPILEDTELKDNPLEVPALSGPYDVYQQILSSAPGAAPDQAPSQPVQPPVVSEPDKPRPRPQ